MTADVERGDAEGSGGPPRRAAGPRVTRMVTLFGAACVTAGVLLCPWTLRFALALLGRDGAISDPADRWLLGVLSFMLLLCGGVNLAFRRRVIVAKLNLLLASLLLVSPLVAEAALRIGIAAGVPALRQPGLYADAMSEDRFWKLHYLWSGGDAGDRVTSHPVLGWAPPVSESNPLGVYSAGVTKRAPSEPAVLFYGDSFVDSPAGLDKSPPALLARKLPAAAVYNFGVSGYGVDQIYLRIRESHGRFNQPYLVVGILTSDLDRSVLQFRGAPKPRFVVSEQGLQPAHGPLDGDVDAWLKANPLRVPSYLLAFLRMRFRLHRPGEFREHHYRRAEKQRVNRAILEQIVRLAERNDLPLLFVLFYEPEELHYGGWREAFLHDELQRLDAAVLDTKPLLMETAQLRAEPTTALYRPDHHLNARGNEAVAAAIADRLRPWVRRHVKQAR